MDQAHLRQITEYVNNNIDSFHAKRLNRIQTLALRDLLKRKNPYLFRAKNITLAQDLITSILDAYLSSSEEELFGVFLEDLAIYVSEITCGGQKSSTAGLDLELTRDNTRYIVAIKSGPNWGNSSQYADLARKFRAAKIVLRQSQRTANVQAVLGICYGKFRTVDKGDYLKIGGQAFWEFISGDPSLYIDLIEPLGYEAKRHNDNYVIEKDNTYNRFIRDFTTDFCEPSGVINWANLITFNSGNL